MKKLYFVGLFVCCLAITAATARTAQSTSQTQDSQEKPGSSVSTPGEPTSPEMRDAVQATIDQYNDNMKQKVTNCRNGEYQNNPLLAAQCLAVYAGGSNDKNDYMVKITKFKKVACTRAPSKPGYNCDYILNLSENTPALLGTLGLTTQGGGKTEGRFVHSDDGWTLITDTNK